jgi:hypothetical protein
LANAWAESICFIIQALMKFAMTGIVTYCQRTLLPRSSQSVAKRLIFSVDDAEQFPSIS